MNGQERGLGKSGRRGAGDKSVDAEGADEKQERGRRESPYERKNGADDAERIPDAIT